MGTREDRVLGRVLNPSEEAWDLISNEVLWGVEEGYGLYEFDLRRYYALFEGLSRKIERDGGTRNLWYGA